jgi:hypothetical protein
MVRGVFRFIDTSLDRVFSVLGAAAFSQFPEFIQQYSQRLGGHLDEAKRQVELITETAAASGKSLQAYIDQFLQHREIVFQKHGAILQSNLDRVTELEYALVSIEKSSVLAKPVVFLKEMDFSIARATLDNFKPAIPLTIENLLYAFIGIFFALTVYHLTIKAPLRFIKRRFLPDSLYRIVN